MALSWPIEAHCCNPSSDTTLSRPHPSTNEEDATNIDTAGQTTHEHKTEDINAEIESLNNRHNSSYKDAQSFKQSAEANIDIPAFTININYRDAVNSNTYLLMRNSLATSYVATTFHPTIGQRAHQSFSNAATLELGMIPLE